MPHKAVVVAGEAKETAKSCDGMGFGPSLDGLYLRGISSYSLLRYDVPEIVHLGNPKVALGEFSKKLV